MFRQWILVTALVASVKASLSDYDVKSYLEMSDQLMQMTPNFTQGYYCWHGPEHKVQWALQKYTQEEYRYLKPVILPMRNDWRMKWYLLFLKYSQKIDHLMKSTYENWDEEERCPDDDNEVEKTEPVETDDEQWNHLILMERYFKSTIKFVRPVLNFVHMELVYTSKVSLRGPYISQCLTQSHLWLEEVIQSGEEALNKFLKMVEEGKRFRRNPQNFSNREEILQGLDHLWRTMKNAILWNCAYVNRFGTTDDFVNRLSACARGSEPFYVKN